MMVVGFTDNFLPPTFCHHPHQVIAAPSSTSYAVESSPLLTSVATIIADATTKDSVPKVTEMTEQHVALHTLSAAAVTAAPNVTAPVPESTGTIRTQAAMADVNAATVQAVQAAIEAARQQGALPYTMCLRNTPPKL